MHKIRVINMGLIYYSRRTFVLAALFRYKWFIKQDLTGLFKKSIKIGILYMTELGCWKRFKDKFRTLKFIGSCKHILDTHLFAPLASRSESAEDPKEFPPDPAHLKSGSVSDQLIIIRGYFFWIMIFFRSAFFSFGHTHHKYLKTLKFQTFPHLSSIY